MTTRRRLRVTATTAHRSLNSETILVHLDSGRIFSVQGAAERAWQLLLADPDPSSVAASLAREFDAPTDVIAADLDRFLEDLASRGFVTWEPDE
jgi:ABC-type uncharacterized transport system auxiliary subunit